MCKRHSAAASPSSDKKLTSLNLYDRMTRFLVTQNQCAVILDLHDGGHQLAILVTVAVETVRTVQTRW